MALQRSAGNAAVALLCRQRRRVRVCQRAAAAVGAERLSADLFAGNDRLQQAFHNAPTLKPGDDRGAVALMQQALDQVFKPMPRSRDPVTGAFDGKWGTETATAVREYQLARGIPPGGFEAGQRTLGALDADLRSGKRRPEHPPEPEGKVAYEPGEVEESRTSPGRIEAVGEGFVLSGFPVGKQFLKPEHRAFLRDLVALHHLDDPASADAVVQIEGFTDAVDAEARNEPLREDRAAAVQTFLVANLGVPEDNVGPEAAAAPGQFRADNHSRAGRAANRAVLIRLGSISTPKPTVVPNKPPPAQSTGPTGLTPCDKAHKSTSWSLQTTVSFSPPLKGGAAATTINFVLRDTSPTGCRHLLQFSGFGGGFGASLPFTIAFPSESSFTTPAAISPKDFEGGGAIRQANVGLGVGFGEALATLHPPTRPADIDISGFEFSAGVDASFVGGTWTLLD